EQEKAREAQRLSGEQPAFRGDRAKRHRAATPISARSATRLTISDGRIRVWAGDAGPDLADLAAGRRRRGDCRASAAGRAWRAPRPGSAAARDPLARLAGARRLGRIRT